MNKKFTTHMRGKTDLIENIRYDIQENGIYISYFVMELTNGDMVELY